MYRQFIGGRGALGLLVLRLVVGAAFVMHGWPKVQAGPDHWMGAEAKVAPQLQAAAAYCELGGGIALILGLLTPLAALAVGGVMVGALALVHVPNHHPFVDPKGGASCELAAVYLAAAFMFLCVGPGTLSMDACLFRRRATAPPAPLPPVRA
jgi:putative oxidoreductase